MSVPRHERAATMSVGNGRRKGFSIPRITKKHPKRRELVFWNWLLLPLRKKKKNCTTQALVHVLRASGLFMPRWTDVEEARRAKLVRFGFENFVLLFVLRKGDYVINLFIFRR